MKTKNTLLVVLNAITFAVMLVVNFLSNGKIIAGVTVADVAHKYDTLFAPADYAFIIWSVIFLLGLCFIIYQTTLIKNDAKQYIQRTGLWFAAGNIANALWCYCWVHEWLGWCLILIVILLLSLVMLTIKLRLELDDEPVRNIFLVWWPIAVYLGWIMVATIACIASWLVYISWHGFGIAAETWAIIMIAVAFLIYLWLTKKRNLRETAGVGIWAFIAIAVRQWTVHNSIAVAALIAGLILSVLSAMHGYKNREYSPFAKLKRGEW